MSDYCASGGIWFKFFRLLQVSYDQIDHGKKKEASQEELKLFIGRKISQRWIVNHRNDEHRHQ